MNKIVLTMFFLFLGITLVGAEDTPTPTPIVATVPVFNETNVTWSSILVYGNGLTDNLGGPLILSFLWLVIFLGSVNRLDGGILASSVVGVIAAMASLANVVSGEYVLVVVGVLVAFVLGRAFSKEV